MKNEFKVLGVIALAAIIGFSFAALSLTACGGGGDGVPIILPYVDPLAAQLNGTYKAADGETITLNNGNFEIAQDDKAFTKGTYTASARSVSANISMAVKQLSGDFLNEILEEYDLDIYDNGNWYTRSQVIDVLREAMEDVGISDDDITDILDDMSSDFDDMYPIITGIIDGDTMTLGSDTYTRTGGNSGSTGDTGGGGTTFTLTGIPSKYEGKYARFTGSGGPVTITGFQTMTSSDIILPQISNGRVTIPLWIVGNTIPYERYTDDGTFMMGTVNFYNSASDKVNQTTTEIVNIAFYGVTFSDGNATKSWSDALVVVEP